ncbi:cytochrome c class I [Thioalkalivibrio sulfidiphilus HL-EbGr7]|uniref:Cytochrome c class I n=1 Tax=Thioalkalivibrio sulfidiphilus (strain HL-EbGR7) TaxID=396588 RepID=B8GTD3_THISH|nr:c-type cytochrome [Thioalkalivibrio sulfidiphilus]ACL71193.1 cytochrome c class I [Thioalkalivibrio sulfidiphilus HL-EbGr7]
MNKYALIALAALGLALSAPVMADAGDATRGKGLSASCAACHGADGNSVNPEWPKLAGQGEAYLFKQLVDYKEGRRQNVLMAGQVANLSTQDMRDLAAFFASQTITPGTADASMVELGEQIYRGGNAATGVAACIACHGPNGQGNPAAMFPKVAGQHAKYNADQLRYFRDESRANDNGRMMRNIARRMTDAEIEAVSQYMAGLSRN